MKKTKMKSNFSSVSCLRNDKCDPNFLISTNDLESIKINCTLNTIVFESCPGKNRIKVILPDFVSYWHSGYKANHGLCSKS